MTATVAALYRYPVKGLSPEPAAAFDLAAGEYLPGDRLFAIENGPAGYDPAAPVHMPKIRFLMLMRDEALARLATRYDPASGILSILEDGREAASGDLATQAGRAAIEAFFARFVGARLRGAPRVLAAAPGFRFTDSRRGFVSIINRASVAAIEEMVGRPVDPLRFRGNLLVEGLAPWAEFDLVGKVLAGPGDLRLEVTDRIVRCAATNVEPGTGLRDLDIPATLQRRLGHADCGVYARVTRSGQLRAGDGLTPVQPELAFS